LSKKQYYIPLVLLCKSNSPLLANSEIVFFQSMQRNNTGYFVYTYIRDFKMTQSCCFWESTKYWGLINHNVNTCHLEILTSLLWHLLFLLKFCVSGANHFLVAGYSDKSDMVKCHKGFLKHNTNILKNWILFILFTSALDYDELYSSFHK